jgi:hypothetical protein
MIPMDSPRLALTADSSDGTMRANAGRFPSPVPRRQALHRKAARACVDGRGKSAALESVMEARIDEIADGIYRLSTFFPDVVPPAGFAFNQFLVSADEPLLFHCALRAMFPSSLAAVGRLLPVERLRWVTFGHFEADECGSMNDWLAVAPQAQVAYGAIACDLSIVDVADRPPRVLADGEVLDLGGKRIRYIDTPHVPHGWDAGVVHEETTGTVWRRAHWQSCTARRSRATLPALSARLPVGMMSAFGVRWPSVDVRSGFQLKCVVLGWFPASQNH